MAATRRVREKASPPFPPLRTVRESFPSYGSSLQHFLDGSRTDVSFSGSARISCGAFFPVFLQRRIIGTGSSSDLYVAFDFNRCWIDQTVDSAYLVLCEECPVDPIGDTKVSPFDPTFAFVRMSAPAPFPDFDPELVINIRKRL